VSRSDVSQPASVGNAASCSGRTRKPASSAACSAGPHAWIGCGVNQARSASTRSDASHGCGSPVTGFSSASAGPKISSRWCADRVASTAIGTFCRVAGSSLPTAPLAQQPLAGVVS
jgi:hypothetical protein